MQILVVWKESLKFFEKKNLSQMGLVTLKTLVQSSKAIYLFMLAALAVMVVVLAVKTAFRVSLGFFFANELIPWTVLIAHVSSCMIFTYLTLRSSVKRKTWDYYISYWAPALKLFVTLFVLIGALRYVTGYYYWWFFLGPIVAWASLFLLDMGPSNSCHFGAQCSCLAHAFLRAFKMAFYNLPIYLVCVLCSSIVWTLDVALANMLHSVIGSWFVGASIMLLLPIEAAFYSNLYIKFLHEQFELYFNSGVKKEV